MLNNELWRQTQKNDITEYIDPTYLASKTTLFEYAVQFLPQNYQKDQDESLNSSEKGNKTS